MVLPPDEEFLEKKPSPNLALLHDGCILLSREPLEDPNFKATVVLICVYNNDGAFGLVLNRPSHMPLIEVFDVEMPQRFEQRAIYIGGPVQQESLQIIHVTDAPQTKAYPVAPHVHLGGEWNSLEDILSQNKEHTRLFLGYSGWAAGQLEREINLGAWDVFNLDLKALILGPEEPLLQDIDAIKDYLESLI
jgi:putative transcriptional regulator